ncbi:hypothetical protein [Azospirillum thermophilum]|uniref:hypothetical protein n=1 Tax=Azospirillum thermophilum TaxID=2202148 RepID=UPI0011B85A06|nr:hypothetical protein [Azospirillum thermophilum]
MPHPIHHQPGTRFDAEYAIEDLTETVRQCANRGLIVFSLRSLHRILDLKLNPAEVGDALKSGEAEKFEVTPSRSEIRVEMIYDQGDMASHAVVTYLSNDHRLFVEDIRDRPRP